ncbi:MAG TPA: O-antigen ligase family protein [Kofleriaceae bacterium]|nr:O-antigen ligase family protein [Kofleriaceae bacterium]
MFAIPGIAALMIFILARPQEFVLELQRVPFLYVFTVLAVIGWVIDIRLRRLQPAAVPTLPWVIALLAWIVIGTAVVAPEHLIERAVEMSIMFVLYATLAHGVQRFRTFQIVAGVMVATCLFISGVCFHQGLSPKQCVAGEEGNDGSITGHPDGRACDISAQCDGPEAEPGKEYRCEHVGAFGTYSVEERVRYRGELHDPNEVSLAISAGALSLLIAFALRRRTVIGRLPYILGVGLVIGTVLLTQSRGGLVCALFVPGVYAVRRYRWWALIPIALLGVLALLLASRGGTDASVSTQQRYEAWATGLALFNEHPLFGVGARLFAEHHYLTAHNSFVLTLAELGFVGMCLFVTVIYLSMKTLIIGLRALARVPGSAAAQVWGMALLASLSGITFQINTLSFAYHSVLWIFFGLVGAWYSAVRHHAPELEVRFTWKDAIAVVGGCAFYAFVLMRVVLRYKGEL